MKEILITINTWNRRKLTLQTLASVFRNKSEKSLVLVIDDHSTAYSLNELAANGAMVMQTPRRFGVEGVGEAFRFAYNVFLDFGLPYLCSLQNDILVAKDFDARLLELHAKHAGPRDCVVGYRSSHWPALEEHGDHVRVGHTAGIGMLASRAAIAGMLSAMPYPKEWDMLYDFKLAGCFGKVIVPKKSLIEHTGAHECAETINPNSGNVAVDFVGEGK